ncbi:MAG TPA: AAA family ATPase [Jiangellaceae bacterium]|nr:AAA family ATPase [Jiangellaceae bacterium]
MTTSLLSPGFVGRGFELQALGLALSDASDGHATAVLLGGEAGVGKSRLIHEFVGEAIAQDARVILGQCVELGGDGLPFAPIAGALRDLSGQLGTERLVEIAGPGGSVLPTLLPELGESGETISDGRGRLFEVVTVLLERASVERPLVFVVEDLHWADASTRDLLRFAIRALDGARVLIIASYRSDEIHRRHPLRPFLAELDRVRAVHRMDLPRLSRDEVEEQLTGIFGTKPAPSVVERIFRRSEGIPFFVEELARAEADGQHGTLPDSLRDLLLVRAEQLSPPAQEVLRVLSAGSAKVDDALLSAVVELDEIRLETALREAVSANLIRVEGQAYAFRHALLREVLHEDVLPGKHARLHTRYAEVLEARPELVSNGSAAVEIAHHWYAAHEHERAFAAYLRAAEDTKRTYAHAETLRLLERALELWHRTPDPEAVAGTSRAGLLRKAAQAAEDAGEMERTLALAEAGLAEPGVEDDIDVYGALLYTRVHTLKSLGRHEALDAAADALANIPATPPTAARARLLNHFAAAHMMDGRFSMGIPLALQAVEVARASAAPEAEMRAYNTLGPSYVHSGDIEAGFTAFETSRRLAEGNPRLAVGYHINYSDSLNLLGRHAEAVEAAMSGIAQAAEIGTARNSGAMLAGNAAEPLIALGRWNEAERLITEAIDLDPPPRHMWHLRTLFAQLQLLRGNLDAARELLEDVQARQAGRAVDSQYAVPVKHLFAQLAIAQGDLDGAWRHVIAALERTASPGYDLPVLATGALVISRLARGGLPVPEDGDAAIRAALSGIGEWGSAPVWRAVIDAELADDRVGSVDQWREVIAAVDAAEGPVHLRPYARYRLAETLVAAGDRAAASDVLRDAATLAGQLDAGLLRQWIGDLARRSGIRLLDQVSSQSTARLTARELEVLRLVAAGRSNREIGNELFISAKTASVHVSNILAKLGASGRVEAAAIAHRDGLLGDAA